MKKGFIFSLSVLFLLSILLWMLFSYANYKQYDNRIQTDLLRAYKIGYTVDDILTDISAVLQTSVDIDHINSDTVIRIEDSLNIDKNISPLLFLETFLNSDYAEYNNLDVNVDLSNIYDGESELFFSNGAEYNYDYTNSEMDLIKDDSNVLAYSIDIFVNAYSDSVSYFDSAESGIYVNFSFHDLNTSHNYTFSGYVDGAVPCGSNSFSANYATGSFNMEICNNEVNNGILVMSENISDSTANIDYNITANDGASYVPIYAEYNAPLYVTLGDSYFDGNVIVASG